METNRGLFVIDLQQLNLPEAEIVATEAAIKALVEKHLASLQELVIIKDIRPIIPDPDGPEPEPVPWPFPKWPNPRPYPFPRPFPIPMPRPFPGPYGFLAMPDIGKITKKISELEKKIIKQH